MKIYVAESEPTTRKEGRNNAVLRGNHFSTPSNLMRCLLLKSDSIYESLERRSKKTVRKNCYTQKLKKIKIFLDE